MQLADLQVDVAQFVTNDPFNFLLQMVSETAFLGLRKVALYILTGLTAQLSWQINVSIRSQNLTTYSCQYMDVYYILFSVACIDV